MAAAHPDASVVAFRDGETVAVFAVRQPLRADAAGAVRAFAADGLSCEIISGDRNAAVAAAAVATGVRDWRAQALPGDKVKRLAELKAGGRHPLMIGDGLNDAPALAEAHASIAPISATHLTQARADLLMMGEQLSPAVDAVRAARHARRLMLQNLWFSAAYNVVAIPIAVLGHATPLVAALAMSGSSLVVMLNALRAGGTGARTQAPAPTAAPRPLAPVQTTTPQGA
jgi:Cu2+-exporting ATPase